MGERMTETAGTEAATAAAAADTNDAGTASGEAAEAAKAEIDWKAKSREWERKAKANADAATKLAQLEESQKTEAQKLADRAAAAEKERDEARLESLRVKVGAAKQLPADVVDLLRGDTEEELTAHADRLAELFKQSGRPSGSADQGQRGAAPIAGPREAMADFINNQLRR